MPAHKLQTVFNRFSRRLRESKRLANDAYRWSSTKGAGGQPVISARRRDSITELAFLRAFLAWEAFLEHSFLVYLTGQIPARGRAPKRYYFPPSQKLARELLADGRDYARWADAGAVGMRATRFFKDGHPFRDALRSSTVALTDANMIRNMIAHESAQARDRFETVVRRELTSLPVNRTAGHFLGLTKPGSTPPTSFLDWYIAKLDGCARQIIPS